MAKITHVKRLEIGMGTVQAGRAPTNSFTYSRMRKPLPFSLILNRLVQIWMLISVRHTGLVFRVQVTWAFARRHLHAMSMSKPGVCINSRTYCRISCTLGSDIILERCSGRHACRIAVVSTALVVNALIRMLLRQCSQCLPRKQILMYKLTKISYSHRKFVQHAIFPILSNFGRIVP